MVWHCTFSHNLWHFSLMYSFQLPGAPRRAKKRRTFAEVEMAKYAGATTDYGLRLFEDDVKGRGVFADIPFAQGEYVSEYRGIEMSRKEGKAREDVLAEQHRKSGITTPVPCYFYYSRERCIDATVENGSLGRLINHSLEFNLKPYNVVDSKGQLRMFLRATRHIPRGEELLYNYGDTKAGLSFLTYNQPPGFVNPFNKKLFPAKSPAKPPSASAVVHSQVPAQTVVGSEEVNAADGDRNGD